MTSEIIIKKLADKFHMTESSAEAKVKSKSVQMVLDCIIDESGEISGEILAGISEEKKELSAAREAFSEDVAKFEEEKKKFDAEKERFEEVYTEFLKAETEDARDRIRILEVYNSIILRSSDESRLSYETYIKGIIAILANQKDI